VLKIKYKKTFFAAVIKFLMLYSYGCYLDIFLILFCYNTEKKMKKDTKNGSVHKEHISINVMKYCCGWWKGYN
jgi:hypothetical protein